MPDMPREAGALQNCHDQPGSQKAHERNHKNPGNEQTEDPEFWPVRHAENVQIIYHGTEASRIPVLRQRASWALSSMTCRI